MTSFLKRLTVKLDGTSGGSHGPTSMMVEDDRAPPRSPLASSVSFNDFSMHVMMDGDHHMYDEGASRKVLKVSEWMGLSGTRVWRVHDSVVLQSSCR